MSIPRCKSVSAASHLLLTQDNPLNFRNDIMTGTDTLDFAYNPTSLAPTSTSATALHATDFTSTPSPSSTRSSTAASEQDIEIKGKLQKAITSVYSQKYSSQCMMACSKDGTLYMTMVGRALCKNPSHLAYHRSELKRIESVLHREERTDFETFQNAAGRVAVAYNELDNGTEVCVVQIKTIDTSNELVEEPKWSSTFQIGESMSKFHLGGARLARWAGIGCFKQSTGSLMSAEAERQEVE
jgi:hypothetical protein